MSLTSVLLALLAGARFTLTLVVGRAISSLVAWLIIAALTWVAARFIFDSRNDYAPILRVAGFAFPTLLVLIITLRVFDGYLGLLLGFVWFVLVLAAGTEEVMDLKREHALGAAAIGFVGWLVVQWLLGSAFI